MSDLTLDSLEKVRSSCMMEGFKMKNNAYVVVIFQRCALVFGIITNNSVRMSDVWLQGGLRAETAQDGSANLQKYSAIHRGDSLGLPSAATIGAVVTPLQTASEHVVQEACMH